MTDVKQTPRRWVAQDAYELDPPTTIQWTCAEAPTLCGPGPSSYVVSIPTRPAPVPLVPPWLKTAKPTTQPSYGLQPSPAVWWIVSPLDHTAVHTAVQAIALQNFGSGFVEVRYADSAHASAWNARLDRTWKMTRSATASPRTRTCFSDTDTVYRIPSELSTTADPTSTVQDVLETWPIVVPCQQLLTLAQYATRAADKYDRWWTVDLSTVKLSPQLLAIKTLPLAHASATTVGLKHIWIY